MATSHGNNRLLESEVKLDSIIAPQPRPCPSMATRCSLADVFRRYHPAGVLRPRVTNIEEMIQTAWAWHNRT